MRATRWLLWHSDCTNFIYTVLSKSTCAVDQVLKLTVCLLYVFVCLISQSLIAVRMKRLVGVHQFVRPTVLIIVHPSQCSVT